MSKSSRVLRVLVVDDEPAIAELIAELLFELGVSDVVTAPNGEHALRILASRPEFPHIIFCDLNMPGMDGVEFVRHLAEQGVRSGLILASGEDERVLKTVHELAITHGLYVLGAISKPVDLETLAGVLHAYDSGRLEETHTGVAPITGQELAEGLEGDALFVVFQPKVDIARAVVCGVEALARWRHRERGVLGPSAFVPLAEESGLIGKLTARAFQQAMKQGGQWHAEGLNLSISVNVTTEDLERLDLPEYIVSSAKSAGMPVSKVILEVTESRIMKNLKASLEILSRLRLKGVGLSIDDFGTGYSSMKQLQSAPFTEIKVDRAFVSGATNDRTARTILESSITLGKNLDMTIVAEGVETPEDWDLLDSLHCDLAQGFLISKPIEGPEVAAWSRHWRPPKG